MQSSSKRLPVESCVNCHFFVQHEMQFTSPVTSEARVAIRNQDYSKLDLSLACALTVWDEGFGADRTQRYDRIVVTDRHNYCFFWVYRPGMMIPAAKLLQEREAHDKDASIDRKNSLIGLWIAAVGLIIAAFGLVCSFLVGLAQILIAWFKPTP